MQSSQCNENSNACGNQLWITDWCGVSHATSLSWWVYRENWEAGCHTSKQATCIGPESWKSLEASTDEENPKAGTRMPVLSVGVRKGRVREYKAWCWEDPDRQKLVFSSVSWQVMLKPAMGNMNSVPLRHEAIKDFPLMGWLVALDYTNFLACSLDFKAA